MSTASTGKKVYTVAVLTYNRGFTAVKSINSVAHDPHVASVCIFDDGSTEENKALLRGCAEEYENVTLVENAKNSGYCNNLMKALRYLSQAKTEYVFLCESDMLLAEGWGGMAYNSFCHSPESVALSAMLHCDQLTPNRSARFRKRCLEGVYRTLADGSKEQIKKPFPSCYTLYPDAQPIVHLGRQNLRYVSNSVGTLIFRKVFIDKIISDVEQLRGYPEQEDAWLAWAYFAYNDFNPKSLMVLDPGIALTFGTDGLHGPMILSNLRWIGSWLWRYCWTSALTRRYYSIRYKFTYQNIRRSKGSVLSRIRRLFRK